MKEWKRKLSSRKLWATIVGVITGIAMIFGLDEGTISTVAGTVTTVGSLLGYIFAESMIDKAAAVNGTADEQSKEKTTANTGQSQTVITR